MTKRARTREPRWKTYEVTAVGSRCSCTTRMGKRMDNETEMGFEVRSDTPRSAGGTNSAPQPVQLLLSALVGCEQATAHFLARKLKMDLDSIEFSIEAQRDEWGSMASPVDEDAGTIPYNTILYYTISYHTIPITMSFTIPY